jgi:hypothetical protein
VSGFGLHDKLLVHDHVQTLFRELVTFVKDSHGDLTRDAMLTRDKLPFQSHHVNVLEKSKTEGVVNIKERPNHRMGEPLLKEVDPCHALKMAP